MMGAIYGSSLPVSCLFSATREILVKSGFIYFPLLFDEELEKELAKSVVIHKGFLVELDAMPFAKGISIESFVSSYHLLAPESYEERRKKVLDRYPFLKRITELPITEKLCTIIFEILPYFTSKPDRTARKKYTRESIADLISKKISTDITSSGNTKDLLNIAQLKETLDRLKNVNPPRKSFPDGIMSRSEFEIHFFELLENQILNKERENLEKTIIRRERFSGSNEKVLSVLLAVAEKGALEINGFGFYETGVKSEFIVYKRTGEYALQDYYGRVYLFPDCRVAISTNGALDPFVIENYKHPFLQKHAPSQKICMKSTSVPSVFNTRNAIFALQEGINALLHGYDYRRRNGYHSLDTLPMPGGSISFEDLMVSKDHPAIREGKVQVTNKFR